jgi:hypothetical protein
VEVVLVAVLAIGMVVETREDHRPARRTTGRGGEGIFKHGAVGCQSVDRRRDGHPVAIAAQRGRLIVGDENDDVSFSR